MTEPSDLRDHRSVAHWDLEFDVVVVGHGAAGGAAAIEAARAGARTLVIERATRGGGAAALSAGILYFGGGTPVQKACGFVDSVENMYNHVKLAAGASADDEKVRLYCEHSVEHFDWFRGIGVEFKESYYPHKVTHPLTDDCLLYTGNEAAWPFSQHAVPVPRGHKPRVAGDAGGYLMECILRATASAGAEVLNETRVETLIRGEGGRIVGVVARVDKQRELAIQARRGVVLAAGGFVMNRELLRKHAPTLLQCNYPLGTPGDDGRGIQMGVGAGGAAINMSEGLVSTPFYPPSDHVKGVMVNQQGQRFINEDGYHGRTSDAILYRQGGIAYCIVDDALYGPTQAFHKPAAVEESFEDLERALEMPQGELVHTLELFNRHAARGEDPLFHKAPEYLRPLCAPPYAALDCRVTNAIYAVFTLGGLDTLPSGEVRSADGRVIAGLYAAGRNSAGLPREGRSYASGMSIGDASFFGRLAGRQAARAPRWQ